MAELQSRLEWLFAWKLTYDQEGVWTLHDVFSAVPACAAPGIQLLHAFTGADQEQAATQPASSTALGGSNDVAQGRPKSLQVDLHDPIYQAMMAAAKADRKSTRLNSSHSGESRMPSSA